MMDLTDTPSEHLSYLRRWSWGAFLGTWLWGLGHRMPFTLICLVPGFNLVVPFVLGIYGNRWAWERGNWDSFETFRAAQQRWARNGFLFFAAVGLIAGLYFARKHFLG